MRRWLAALIRFLSGWLTRVAKPGRVPAGPEPSIWSGRAARSGSAPGPSIFAAAGAPASTPDIRASAAPSRPVFPSPRSPGARGGDPRIQRLRRAAVMDMFDQVGLAIVPGQIWRFIDGEADPAVGLVNFLSAIGVDADAVRRREVVTIADANDLLELLVLVEPAFRHLAPAALSGLEAVLFSGERDRIREAARIVGIYELIRQLGSHWPVEDRLHDLSDFLADVAGELDDPLAATLGDAQSARRIADMLAERMARFDHLRRVDAAARAALAAIAGWESQLEAAEIVEQASIFDALVTHLLEQSVGLAELDAILLELVDRNRRFAAAVDGLDTRLRSKSGTGRRRGGSSKGAGTAPPPPIYTELEQALLFFGFEISDRPDWSAVTMMFRSKMKTAHPDAGGTKAAAQEVSRQREVLRRALVDS